MKIHAILILLLLTGCSSLSKSNHQIQIDTLENLNAGKSTKRDVAKQLGEADLKMSPDQKNGLEIWSYFDGKVNSQPRLNLAFDAKTQKLKSFRMTIDPRESESQLRNVLSQFPQAKFQSHTLRIDGAQTYGTYPLVYEDPATGLTITWSKIFQRVEFISWAEPVDTKSPTE